jgi:UDP-2,3-diacylglucosamine pyrophosphatase LpxH
MATEATAQPRRVRTLFVSDVHLGCRYAQHANFLEYLEGLRPDQVFIVGDFLDGWKLRSRWRWDATSTAILRKLLAWNQYGARLCYVPGNHDNFLRHADVQRLLEHSGLQVEMQDEFVFTTQDGKDFLVTHGDMFDVVEMRLPLASSAASLVYDPLLAVNWLVSRLRTPASRSRRSPYAFSALAKNKVKQLVRFISNFEQRLFAHARQRGCCGVICGHIHRPGVVQAGDMTYVNTGDWVENCTAVVENYDGSIWLESYFEGFERLLVHAPCSSWIAEQEALFQATEAPAEPVDPKPAAEVA